LDINNNLVIQYIKVTGNAKISEGQSVIYTVTHPISCTKVGFYGTCMNSGGVITSYNNLNENPTSVSFRIAASIVDIYNTAWILLIGYMDDNT